MRKAANHAVVYLTLFALMVVVSPVGAMAAQANARLEGMIVGLDGKVASGFTVHLIAENGAVLQSATTNADGLYSFADLATGSYALGVETADGTMAPVATPPIQIGENELARRDIKLVQADSATANQVATSNYAVGSWWAGLSGGAKAGVIIGLAAVTYGVVEAYDDDDDEAPGSPSIMPVN